MTVTERLMFTVLLSVIVLGLLIWFDIQGDIHIVEERVVTSERETIENRALQCRLLLGLGLPTQADGPCFEPEVLQYYDPQRAYATNVTSSEVLDTLCEIALAHDISYVAACVDRED